MQHLDDALIAEWVDGAIGEDSPQHGAIAAHVDRCEECRSRVEEERALAGHVRQLLGVAAPPDRTPPFEEVLHRAGSAPRRAPLSASTVWMRRLAWAATVVVAGGVGWYARGVLVESPRELADAAGGTGTTGATGTPGALDAAAERDDALADAAVLREQSAAPAATGRVAGLAEAREEAAGGQRAATAVDEGRRQPATAERRAAEDAVAARRDAAPPAAPPAAAEFRPVAQAAAPAENELQLGKASREPWTAATRAAAEAVLRAPLVLLADLPVAGIEISADGGAVRVRQDLGPGVTLELVQLRAADAVASSLAAGAVTDAEARLQRAVTAPAVETRVIDGVWIMARAPVTADSLRALVARLGT
jgi:hypothetical protein